MSRLQELIVKYAKADIGNKELKGNSGFVSKIKEARLKLMGWIKGQSWCAYNAESIWKYAFSEEKPSYVKLLDKYFSGSTVTTWKNFRKSAEFKTSPNIPVIGALAIWQDGETGLGHIGVVTTHDQNRFKSVEGNTNESGSREGTIVRENDHLNNLPFDPKSPKKRWLMGFVYPDPIA